MYGYSNRDVVVTMRKTVTDRYVTNLQKKRENERTSGRDREILYLQYVREEPKDIRQIDTESKKVRGRVVEIERTSREHRG